jgi:hypothetical protein
MGVNPRRPIDLLDFSFAGLGDGSWPYERGSRYLACLNWTKVVLKAALWRFFGNCGLQGTPHVLRRWCADARDPISSFRIAANISETENWWAILTQQKAY